MATLTSTRPAGPALERHLARPTGLPSTETAELDAIAVQQALTTATINRLVAAMDDETKSFAELDVMTEEIARLLARAEQLRVDRARAAARRLGDVRRWGELLDLD